jgi:rhodanese-related sulfurtransferase
MRSSDSDSEHRTVATTDCQETTMPLVLRKSVKQLVDEALAEIETLTVEQARALLGRPDVTFIDLRDPRELWREGGMPGAVNVTRGMLEFWIDPASPYHKDFFASGNRFVFFCAGGWRSALAAKTAQDMGLTPVAHLDGGFGAWKKSGAPVEAVEPKPMR